MLLNHNTTPSPPPMTVQISKCLVKPSSRPDSAVNIRHLTPWDLAMFSIHYIQKGLLFSNIPSSLSIDTIIHRLKSSLSAALFHFYPLAGRLLTEPVFDSNNEVSGRHVSIECASLQGAEFIHALASDVTVDDVLALGCDVPSFIKSFFPLNGAVNHDGHSLPLLSIQLTQLPDGVFVACCFNHVVGDGTSYWHFFNAWAEIARSKEGNFALSRPPVHDRWFIEGESPPMKLPFSSEDEFLERYDPPPFRERIFHFSSHSIACLKEKANKECNANMISSFQALSSLVWRSITRVRCFPPDQQTSCRLAIQNHARLRPPLSPDYFGNSIYAVMGTTTAGELMSNGLGWAASLLHQAVRAHTDDAIRALLKTYHEKPMVYRLSEADKYGVMMGSSPRFDMYTCDFGWGKPVAVRSSTANKFEGKVKSYPGREGGGSVDLEVCLSPEDMASLLVDDEFMTALVT